jgi:hypothetical protein
MSIRHEERQSGLARLICELIAYDDLLSEVEAELMRQSRLRKMSQQQLVQLHQLLAKEHERRARAIEHRFARSNQDGEHSDIQELMAALCGGIPPESGSGSAGK